MTKYNQHGHHGHKHGHGFGKKQVEVVDTIVKTVATTGDTKAITSAIMELAGNNHGRPVKTLIKAVVDLDNPVTISLVITALKGLEDNPFALRISERIEKIVAKKAEGETKPDGKPVDESTNTKVKVDDSDKKGSDTGPDIDHSTELHQPDITSTSTGE